MKQKRFNVEQIVAVLKQVEAGVPLAELIRRVGISEQTFSRWKKQYVGLERTHRLRLSNGKLGIIRERKQTPTLIEYLESSVMPWAASQFATKPKNLKWYKDNQQVLTAYEPLTNARLGDIGKELAGRI